MSGTPTSATSSNSTSPPTPEPTEGVDCGREAAAYAAHWHRLSCLELTAKFESTRAMAETWARRIKAGERTEDEAGQECLRALAGRFGEQWVRDGERDVAEIARARKKACLAEKAVGAKKPGTR
jgi:hypothetical protein